jgi:hypothetical protein
MEEGGSDVLQYFDIKVAAFLELSNVESLGTCGDDKGRCTYTKIFSIGCMLIIRY